MGYLLARQIDERVEAGVVRGRAEGLAQGLERGLEQGLERGLEQGLAQERAMLSRLAARKFDAGAGARLAALLADIADPDRLAEVGDRLIDCADDAELLARAREIAQRG